MDLVNQFSDNSFVVDNGLSEFCNFWYLILWNDNDLLSSHNNKFVMNLNDVSSDHMDLFWNLVDDLSDVVNLMDDFSSLSVVSGMDNLGNQMSDINSECSDSSNQFNDLLDLLNDDFLLLLDDG